MNHEAPALRRQRQHRQQRHGSSNGSMPSQCRYFVGDTRLLGALLVVLVKLATAFVADIPATLSPSSSRSGSSCRGSCSNSSIGPKGSSSGRYTRKVFSPLTASDRTTTTTTSSRRGRGPVWWPSRAGTRLWIAGEEQQQQGRQHRRHGGESSSRGVSSSSSSSSSSSGAKMNAPVLPVVGDIKRANMDALRVRQRCRGVDGVEEEEEAAGGFVEQFRACAPYIRAHLGAVMVIHMGGEVVEDPNFMSIMEDLGLLSLLGTRLVIVTGARPQVSTLLRQAGIKEEFRDDLRITSKEALQLVKAAAGFVRIEVESALSRGGRAGNAGGFHVVGGNYFSAQPVGVRNGVDYGCTGEVRKVEADRIRAQLNEGGVVHLTCIGYSGSGEVFNVNSVDLAARCAASLGASKVVYIAENDGSHLEDTITGEIINSLRLSEARQLLSQYKKHRENGAAVAAAASLSAIDLKGFLSGEAEEGVREVFAEEEAPTAGGAAGGSTTAIGTEQKLMTLVEKAVMALTQGVARAHVVPPKSGALLQELYTRDGAGLLISRDIYDGIRPANPGDIPGIREIIAPLEEKGVLVPRLPEKLEAAILQNEYFVITRDGSVLGVAFFKRYGNDHAEVGCLAIHRDYRKRGWGEAMLSYLERVALASSVKHLFVLSTVTMQWFVERGFEESQVSELPLERRDSYNWERMSKIYLKTLGGGARAVDAEELLWDVRGMV